MVGSSRCWDELRGWSTPDAAERFLWDWFVCGGNVRTWVERRQVRFPCVKWTIRLAVVSPPIASHLSPAPPSHRPSREKKLSPILSPSASDLPIHPPKREETLSQGGGGEKKRFGGRRRRREETLWWEKGGTRRNSLVGEGRDEKKLFGGTWRTP